MMVKFRFFKCNNSSLSMVVNWDSVINYRSKKIITRKKVVLIAGRKADL